MSNRQSRELKGNQEGQVWKPRVVKNICKIHKCLSFPSKLFHLFSPLPLCCVLNTFAAGPNQSVRGKTAGSHIALYNCKSGIKSARELCKPSKDLASLVVFLVGGFIFFVSEVISRATKSQNFSAF